MATEIQLDALPPAKMAARMEEVGVTKAELKTETMFALAILAGAFIGCGAIFATVVMTGLPSAGMGYGVVNLLAGLAFCLGLVAVVVAGAELFTGNNLIVMAFASGRITLTQLMRNWGIVYVGNFVGSILTAVVMLLTRQYMFANGGLGASALTIASAKCSLAFLQAIALGVMCNALVCLAIWLCSSSRSTTDKILAVIFPITAFVAAGFEHCVANMYFIPMGLLIKSTAPTEFWKTVGMTASDLPNLTWGTFFLKNLLPVTMGNVIGGAGFVGLVYWFIYLQPRKVVELAEEAVAQILVVDDDPDFVEVSRRILAKNGYQVTAAVNGEQALQAMRTSQPDLVLLDVMMATPLDGVEVVRKMANDPALAAIPIIMISSIDSSQHAAKLPDDVRIPIDAWISKPVEPEHLLKTVQRFHA
jgi:formate transporter